MVQLEKLLIKGIRSYHPNDSNKIEFKGAMTLIIGANGTGKTTIIECLKYITTGNLPPNSKGGAFVYDPRLAKEVDIKAQVKLTYRDGNGKKMESMRTIQCTRKGSKVEQKTLESVGEGLGPNVSLLDSVVFCHQDESTWVLSEPSVVKKKLDDVFSSTKFSKALEAVKATKRNITAKIKMKYQELEFLYKAKEKKREVEERVGSISKELKNKKQSRDKYEEDIKECRKLLEEVNQDLEKVEKIEKTIEEIKKIEERKPVELKMNKLEAQEIISENFENLERELKKEESNLRILEQKKLAYERNKKEIERKRELIKEREKEIKKETEFLKEQMAGEDQADEKTFFKKYFEDLRNKQIEKKNMLNIFKKEVEEKRNKFQERKKRILEIERMFPNERENLATYKGLLERVVEISKEAGRPKEDVISGRVREEIEEKLKKYEKIEELRESLKKEGVECKEYKKIDTTKWEGSEAYRSILRVGCKKGACPICSSKIEVEAFKNRVERILSKIPSEETMLKIKKYNFEIDEKIDEKEKLLVLRKKLLLNFPKDLERKIEALEEKEKLLKEIEEMGEIEEEKLRKMERDWEKERESFIKKKTLVEQSLNKLERHLRKNIVEDLEEVEEVGDLDSSRDKIYNLKTLLLERREKLEDARRHLEYFENEERKKKYISSSTLSTSSKKLRSSKASLENKLSELLQSKARLLGEINQLNISLSQFSKDLKKDYSSVEKEYNTCYLQHRLLDYSLKDLDSCICSLDRAILDFHSQKIQDVNRLLKDLWVSCYKGNDIDYIELKAESLPNKTYSYRISQIKNGVELEMRGRCSAGQKMLASILVRLALANSFHASVLALDEPTTNLDRDNIESLALALVKIVREKGLCHLIVITHDEDFVNLLSRECCEGGYYRLKRDDNGNSQICRIVEK
ncbi:DNA repair protein RAD50 [Nosema granulosis]|uniref:DNA repair protein RAD50 n=1 Tax=Nosema granulosis TaxID=83296 RepID=A0A9P6KZW9_9MICR|nr:DNA repair protein RAD50 [Nosema granulosis]